MASATPALAWEDILPQSSQVFLTGDDLGGLDCDQLWHARNEIYARNGYKFLTARAKAEFGTDGTTRNPQLNRFEQKNIALIQAAEAASYCAE
ncbi:MAG: YARHG domain-containing protein [Rhizobiales bacterium]|nr:YARHG domain-containing protein [Hyphomicrobiales bacterium]MBN9009249.1 YARHG domain-containing protein [Hyphomicrobiales bacterium]